VAERYEGPDAEADWLFTGCVIRLIDIVRKRDIRPEPLRKARLDAERCLAKDPGAIVAVGARGLILALERQTELAREDIDRLETYTPGVGVFLFAKAIVTHQMGGEKRDESVKKVMDELGQIGADRKTLYEWAETLAPKGR
jgi:hypothetical protein